MTPPAVTTIAAATGRPTPADRAVIRLSGPRAWELAAAVLVPGLKTEGCRASGVGCQALTRNSEREHSALEWRPWRVAEARLALAGWPAVPVRVLPFRAPRSYTGEDLIELHLPGAPVLVEAVLAALFAVGAEPAAPGAFTLRALLNGRLDLAQAESVAELIAAEDEAGRRAALRGLQGVRRAELAALRDALADLCLLLELGIDFSEEDVTLVAPADYRARVAAAAAGLAAAAGQLGERGPDGPPRAALVGPPNAGKSTLFNALVGRAAHLVSEVPGTTRDAPAAPLDWEDARFVLVDTAGETAFVEPAGETALVAPAGEQVPADRAGSGREAAVWFPSPPGGEGRAPTSEGGGCRSAPHHDVAPGTGATTAPPAVALAEFTERHRRRALAGADLLIAVHRADRLPPEPPGATLRVAAQIDRLDAAAQAALPAGWLALSAHSGAGIDRLRAELAAAVRRLPAGGAFLPHSRALLARAQRALADAADCDPAWQPELAALALREALDALGLLVGAVTRDDLLDAIFGRFCIGK